MRLSEISWLTETQVALLEKHNVVTLGQLASCELSDSLADAVPVDGLRSLARRARASLGHPDPLTAIGQAAGHDGPVCYAGGVTYGDGKG